MSTDAKHFDPKLVDLALSLVPEFLAVRKRFEDDQLVDAVDRVLPMYSESLSAKAAEQLKELGVEILTGKKVKDIQSRLVILDDRAIEAENILWTAGVSANRIAQKLNTPTGKGGRLEVEPDCSLPGHPEVFAIGDIAVLTDAKGRRVPGVCPAAIQMGRHAARTHSCSPSAAASRRSMTT